VYRKTWLPRNGLEVHGLWATIRHSTEGRNSLSGGPLPNFPSSDRQRVLDRREGWWDYVITCICMQESGNGFDGGGASDGATCMEEAVVVDACELSTVATYVCGSKVLNTTEQVTVGIVVYFVFLDHGNRPRRTREIERKA
jgi:hypothetical protein